MFDPLSSSDKAEEMQKRVSASQSYDEAFQVVMEYTNAPKFDPILSLHLQIEQLQKRVNTLEAMQNMILKHLGVDQEKLENRP